jgi:hypothetical protein
LVGCFADEASKAAGIGDDRKEANILQEGYLGRFLVVLSHDEDALRGLRRISLPRTFFLELLKVCSSPIYEGASLENQKQHNKCSSIYPYRFPWNGGNRRSGLFVKIGEYPKTSK